MGCEPVGLGNFVSENQTVNITAISANHRLFERLRADGYMQLRELRDGTIVGLRMTDRSYDVCLDIEDDVPDIVYRFPTRVAAEHAIERMRDRATVLRGFMERYDRETQEA